MIEARRRYGRELNEVVMSKMNNDEKHRQTTLDSDKKDVATKYAAFEKDMRDNHEKKKHMQKSYGATWMKAKGEKEDALAWQQTVGKAQDAEIIAGDVQRKLRKE